MRCRKRHPFTLRSRGESRISNGYTSDEDGIRHALLEEQEKVDIADAVFMFGACTSFTAYLVNKARTAGLLKQGGR